MEYLLQQLINGVTLGSIYGLIAIGYTMVFGIIGMVNFAHGDVFMLSTFIALIFLLALTQIVGIPSLALALFIVLILGMLLTALWAWAIERTTYSTEGQPVDFEQMHYRGDRIRYTMRLKRRRQAV